MIRLVITAHDFPLYLWGKVIKVEVVSVGLSHCGIACFEFVAKVRYYCEMANNFGEKYDLLLPICGICRGEELFSPCDAPPIVAHSLRADPVKVEACREGCIYTVYMQGKC